MNTVKPHGNRKHGFAHHNGPREKIYKVWHGMKSRCFNENVPEYPRYGGIGLTVCDRWKESFSAFLEDMGLPPEGMTLERKDNSKGYSPDNCVWASLKDQCRNRKTNRPITVNGKTKLLVEWSEITGLKVITIWARLSRGWSPEDAVTKPRQEAKLKAWATRRAAPDYQSMQREPPR